MSQTHDEIKQAFESYIAESEAFETKGVKAAAARARKALGLLGKATKVRRKEYKRRKTLCNHSEWLLDFKGQATVLFTFFINIILRKQKKTYGNR